MDESILGTGWWFYQMPLILVTMSGLGMICTFIVTPKPTDAGIIISGGLTLSERLEVANSGLWLWYVAFGVDLLAVIVLLVGGLASTGQIVFGLLTLPAPLIARARCAWANAIRCDLADRAVFDTVNGRYWYPPREERLQQTAKPDTGDST